MARDPREAQRALNALNKRNAEKLNSSLKPPKEHFEDVCKIFKDCLTEYRKETEQGFRAILYGMDQELWANKKVATQNASVKSSLGVMTQCEVDQKITLYHGFQTAGDKLIPIGNTEFKIHEIELKDGFWHKVLASLVIADAAQVGLNASNAPHLQYYDPIKGILEIGPEIKFGDKIKNNLNQSSPNKLNEQGRAEIEGLDCNKIYNIQFSPKLTQDDFNALFNSYHSLIEQLLGYLQSVWDNPEPDDEPDSADTAIGIGVCVDPNAPAPAIIKKTQSELYQEFYDSVQDGSYQQDDLAIIGAAIKGIIAAFIELWDGLSTIFLWVTNPQSYADVVKYLSNPDKMVADLEKAAAQLENMLSILKDEALLFIMLKAVIAFISLLTPQQAKEFCAEGVSKGLVQLVISMIVPGKVAQVLLDAAFTTGAGMKETEKAAG